MNALNELGKQFLACKEKDAELKKLQKENDAEWNAIEEQMIELMVQEGIKSQKVDGIGNIILSTSEFFSVTADKKPGFFEYLKESGNDGILKLDVNAQTLKSFLDQHFDELVQALVSEGSDEMDAKTNVRNMLIDKGCGVFTKRGVSIRKV